MATLKKVKLGKKASSFFDAVSRVKVAPGQVVTLSKEQAKSPKVKSAIERMWLVETTEEVSAKVVVEETVDTDDSDNDFAKMTIAELLTYVEDNYELEEDEMAKVKTLKKAELVEYVEELEKEED